MNQKQSVYGWAVLLLGWAGVTWGSAELPLQWVEIEAKTKEDRSRLVDLGVDVETVYSDRVWALLPEAERQALVNKGIPVLSSIGVDQISSLDFPVEDARFHNYAELQAELVRLNRAYPELTRLVSLGKSVEGRDLWAIHINTNAESLRTGMSSKPGIVFMGNHHAREHLSLEIPLMLTEFLLKNKSDAQVQPLIGGRDIWIIPMVNPDGVEFDLSTGRYKMWRKNRTANGDGTFGVDLNRNYGYKWGTGGSSSSPSSDIYKGPQAFSEPETRVIRDFVDAHINLKVLLSFHTFSELILYPWGHTYDGIGNTKDQAVFKKMAETMAQWNHYKPEQSSELYITSGDTTDWAYGTHGIYAFTFELSPRSQWDGGFYPGAGVIDRVFQDNLKPCLYLIDRAGDPARVLEERDGEGSVF